LPPIEWFIQAGVMLFGNRWQVQMAELLGVNRRTVDRYIAGEWAIPPARVGLVVTALRLRAADLLKHQRAAPR
jgi:DNA-binding transcriptional regulator YdaS (Cro superfamily)